MSSFSSLETYLHGISPCILYICLHKNRWPIFPFQRMYKCHLINKKSLKTTLSQKTTIIDGALFSFKWNFILYIYHISNSLKTFLFKLRTNRTSLKSRTTPKEFGRKWRNSSHVINSIITKIHTHTSLFLLKHV